MALLENDLLAMLNRDNEGTGEALNEGSIRKRVTAANIDDVEVVDRDGFAALGPKISNAVFGTNYPMKKFKLKDDGSGRVDGGGYGTDGEAEALLARQAVRRKLAALKAEQEKK